MIFFLVVYNWVEVKTKMWILNLGKPVNIPVLNEAMAIELGANILGEAVIFIIAAGILISEYNRSAKKEAAKEAAKKQEIQQIQDTLRELFIQTEEQGAHIRELKRKFYDLETKVYGRRNNEPEKPPPPPPQPTRVDMKRPIVDDVLLNNFTIKNTVNRGNGEGLILRSINEVKNDFFYPDTEREDGIVLLSLQYLYRNVLKLNI